MSATLAAPRRVPGSIWLRIGAWLSVVTAVGHMLGNHSPLAPRPTPELTTVIDAMRHVILPITGKSFWLGYLGDSLMLSVLSAGFGLVNLLFERTLRKRGEAVPVALLAVDIGVTIASLAITALCFPPQPLVGATVALLLYLGALAQVLLSAKRRNETPAA